MTHEVGAAVTPVLCAGCAAHGFDGLPACFCLTVEQIRRSYPGENLGLTRGLWLEWYFLGRDRRYPLV